MEQGSLANIVICFDALIGYTVTANTLYMYWGEQG